MFVIHACHSLYALTIKASMLGVERSTHASLRGEEGKSRRRRRRKRTRGRGRFIIIRKMRFKHAGGIYFRRKSQKNRASHGPAPLLRVPYPYVRAVACFSKFAS
jgi:hypothetical protein